MQRRQFLLGVGLFWTPRPAAASGWVRLADMPVARSEMPATVHAGSIYVAGGFGAGNLAHRYLPRTDEWERISDLPVETNHPGITTFRDQVVVAGGYGADGSTAHNGMWAYRPDRDVWEQIGELPDRMGAFGFAVAHEDLFLMGGATGSLNGEPSGATWRWDPALSQWENRAPMPSPREHLATVAVGDAIFAIGGRVHGQDDASLGSATEQYDPTVDAWITLPPMPHPRSGLNGGGACGSVIVAGGETSRRVFADVQRFDISIGSWESLPDLPDAVHGVAVATFENHVYAIGGSTAAGRIQNVASTWALNVDEVNPNCR